MKFHKSSYIIALSSLLLFAAGCSLFGSSIAAGFIKTTSGGADWQFANKYSDNTTSLAGITVSTLSFDPQNREHVYAGSYSDGLFFSQDSGGHWTRILSKIGVYDFAIDPQNSQHIYASGFYADHGKVYETKDGGKSWVEIFNDAGTQNAARSIAINPGNVHELIIAMTNGSLIKSEDGGGSWKLAQDFKDKINRLRFQAGKLFILCETKGLLESTDAGQSFTEITASLRGSNSFFSNVISSADTNVFYQFALSPLNSSTLYVTTGNGLFKSLNEGGSWQKMPLPVKTDGVVVRAVAIAPASDNIVYASAGSTIYKTLDGGANWQTQSIATSGFVNVLAVDPQFAQIAYGGIFYSK